MYPRTAKRIIADYEKMKFSEFADKYNQYNNQYNIRHDRAAEKLYEKAKEIVGKNK